MRAFLPLLMAMAVRLHAQWIPTNPVVSVAQQHGGVLLKLEHGALPVEVCADSIVHVIYSATETVPSRTEYVVTKSAWPAAKWTLQDTPRAVTVSTDRDRKSTRLNS